jgi:hypothetical protein
MSRDLFSRANPFARATVRIVQAVAHIDEKKPHRVTGAVHGRRRQAGIG